MEKELQSVEESLYVNIHNDSPKATLKKYQTENSRLWKYTWILILKNELLGIEKMLTRNRHTQKDD